MAPSSADIQNVYALLQNALSQKESIRKPAELALGSCENKPGFCSCLLEILSAKELDKQGQARWLAVVYFKNSINRYWRTGRDTPGITQEEKPHLRSKLLELLHEENNQVAVQLAVLISKIARFDYPREWRELFPTLLQKLQSTDVLIKHRVYLVLNQVLKELSTKRLGIDQRNFAEVTAQLFEYTWSHWYSDTQAIIQGFSTMLTSGSAGLHESDSAFTLSCERWLLCLKTVRRMLIFGFQSDLRSVQEVPAVQRVMPAFREAVNALLQIWSAVKQQQERQFLRQFLEKACLKLLKTVIDVQETHPYSFSNKEVLLPVLELCYTQVTEAQGEDLFEQFLIQCMILLQAVLKCVAYNHPKMGSVVGETALPSLEKAKGSLAALAKETVQLFFSQKRVVLLCNVLVQRFFMLTPADLDDWAADAEGFNHEQDLVQWRDKLRPCAEALFLTMFENYREVLAPVVMEMVQHASQNCPPPAPDAEVSITPALLLKDACYDALGVANYDLYDYLDFKTWYETSLAPEIANRHPNGRILRRRVAWLLGQWVSKIKGELRRPVYKALLELLGEGDLAVQLAACRSLCNLIDDVHFYEDEFVEFVEPCLQLLFLFMSHATEFDSQLQVMNLVSLIIERSGEKVVPCAEQIMSFLPQVWQQSEGQSLVRIQVMLALQRLLIALGPRSPVCYDLLFPMLLFSTDINQPDELNMLEDGLQLWETTLQYAPTMVPPLLALFPHLVAIMNRNFDYLLVAMQIMESYILVGGGEFLQQHAQSVVQILEGVVGNVKEKGMLLTLGVIDTLIQCFPSEAPPGLERVLQKLLLMVVAGGEPELVAASAVTVLARVLLQNGSFFGLFITKASTSSLLAEMAPRTGPAAALPSSPLLRFLDSWLSKVDSLSSASKRKLSALALCCTLTFPERGILDRLEQIISVAVGAAMESVENDNEASPNGRKWVGQSGFEGELNNTTQSGRQQQVYNMDPVNTMSVAAALREKLNACSAAHGSDVFNAAMAKVHPAVLAQLNDVMRL